MTFFLGLQIKPKKSKCVRDLFKKYNMDQCKSSITPMSATISLYQDLNAKSVDHTSYRGMIG